MKKLFFFLLAASAVALSCNKEINSNDEANLGFNNGLTPSLTATFEASNDVTKATINGSNQIVWKSGDQIGLRLYKGSNPVAEAYGYSAWDATLVLDGGSDESTSGVFNFPDGDYTGVQWGYTAFYPRFYPDNYVDGSKKVSFLYKTEYTGYVSGSELMPMVANLVSDPTNYQGTPSSIAFKHVGGAIKVTLNDVPKEISKVSLSIEGEAITGRASVDPTEAGTAAISTSDVDGTAGDPVFLTFGSAASDRDQMVFYFPVPTVDAPVITLTLYYGDIAVWSKTTKSAQANIGRADVLPMKAINLPTFETMVSDQIVYVLDDMSWAAGDRALYMWETANGSNKPLGAWPGQKSFGTKTFGDKTYQMFVIPTNIIGTTLYSMIFNNNDNGSQTNDMVKYKLKSSQHIKVSSSHAWVVSTPSTPEDAPASVNFYFAMPSTQEWNIHYWDGDVTATTWPGKALSSSVIGGKTYYYCSIVASEVGKPFKFLVNYGGDTWKTANQDAEACYLLNDRFYNVASDKSVTAIVDPR